MPTTKTTPTTNNNNKKNIEYSTAEQMRRFFMFTPKISKAIRHCIIKSCIFGVMGIFTILVMQEAMLAIELGDNDKLLTIALVYAGVMIVYQIWNFWMRRRGYPEAKPQHLHQVYKTLMHDYILLHQEQATHQGTGKTIDNILKGVGNWTDLLLEAVITLPKVIIMTIFSFIVIISLGGRYGGLFLVFFILIHRAIVPFNKRSLISRRKRRIIESKITRWLVKLIMAKGEVLQNAMIDTEIKNHKALNQQYSDHWSETNKWTMWIFNLPRMAINLLYTLSFVFIAIQGDNIGWSVSDFVLLITTIAYLEARVLETVGFYKTLEARYIYVEKLRSFFDGIETIKGYDTGKKYHHKKGELQFDNISFGYNTDKKIFNNFSLTIAGGKKTAFVGHSGSGKTTLMKLMMGYLRPDEGKLLIDNQDLMKTQLKSYYPHVGYLTQDPGIFDGSVRENLTYAVSHRNISDKDIDHALKQSACEFVYDLINGLDTQIGERGVKLSGGEKQRLAIAKIFLKNPEIILLDEPTSALNSFSEDAITQAMHNLFENRTVVIIAHRLQTVKKADQIIVLDKGEVIEKGNHKTLASKENGVYHSMIDLQSGWLKE